MARADLPPALLAGARRFDAGDVYGAHEVWEEHWLAIGGSARDFYKGLIQVAVAFHHWERGNETGARKLARSGAALLARYAPAFHGVDVAAFLAALDLHLAPLRAAAAAKIPAPPPDPRSRPRLNLEPETQ